MQAPKSPSEYIRSFPPAVQKKLREIRELIRAAAPEATESISYGMPVFKLGGPLVYYGGFKNHVSFFPTASGIRAFKKELSGFEISAGTLRLPLEQPLPRALLKRMVQFRLAELKQAKKNLPFRSKIERLAVGLEYYGISVPAKVTAQLQTRAAIPVRARLNDSAPFRASLYPVGEGRHFLRVKNALIKSLGLGSGSPVRVEIKPLDPAKKSTAPNALLSAVREAGVKPGFDLIPPGTRNFLLRKWGEAVQPATRAKRTEAILSEARRRMPSRSKH